MIKINLLPYRSERKKELLTQQLMLGGIPLLLCLIVIGSCWFSITSRISSTDEEIGRLNRELEKQKTTIRKIEEFKKKKAILEKKMDIIKKLQQGKSGPVHLLDELSSNLPGKLWLTEIKQKGMAIDITGNSLGEFPISSYMTSLNKSPYFKSIDLKYMKADKISGSKARVKKFIITGTVTYEPRKADAGEQKKN